MNPALDLNGNINMEPHNVMDDKCMVIREQKIHAKRKTNYRQR